VTGEVVAESAIRAMESLIQTNFGHRSPSTGTLEDCCTQSPGATSSGCRSQSVPVKVDEDTTSGASGSSSRPPSVALQASLSPVTTPCRAQTPPCAADDVHIDDEDHPSTPARSPLYADSSTFSAACQDAVKEERLEEDLNVVDETSMKRRSSDADCSDAKRRAEDRQQTRQNSAADVDHAEDDGPTSTSGRLTALESLQGLVYRQTINSEHPLDSLQRLIYGGSCSEPSHVSVQLAAGQSAVAGDPDMADLQLQTGKSPVLAPQTLILVNPIVTVVSQAANSDVPSTPKPSAVTGGGGGGSAGESSGSSEDAGEQAVPVPRVYRCRACRRKFSSKGSYRYHLSRCHALASPKAACEAPGRHKYHHHRHDRDSSMTDPASDVSIASGTAFGGCAPLEDSGHHLQAQYFAEAK